ncbi:MAG: hypothetical protein LBV26_06385 [Bacteroidales bacterium]|nr:hypothetical protein [Bacteroidales bacterium]
MSYLYIARLINNEVSMIYMADTEIDRLVYVLYGLTREEITIIENN